MIKHIYYECEYCGETFRDSEECRQHEEKCNPCNSCEHAYYVYGCEFACRYEGNCGKHGEHQFWKRKENKK